MINNLKDMEFEDSLGAIAVLADLLTIRLCADCHVTWNCTDKEGTKCDNIKWITKNMLKLGGKHYSTEETKVILGNGLVQLGLGTKK